MTLTKTKETMALFSLYLLLFIPFIGPYRYYNATGFMNDMLTVSSITLVLISTLVYCKKIVIPLYLSILVVGGILLIAITFFNTTYNQNRLNLVIWLVSVSLISICVSSIKNKYVNDYLFKFKLATYLFYSSFLIAITSFLTFYFANPFSQLTKLPINYSHLLRMDGFLGQPNLLAIILFLGIVACTYISNEIRSNYRIFIYALMLFLISYCLFATLSRIAFLALCIFTFYAAIYTFRQENKKEVWYVFLVIVLAYFSYYILNPYLIEYSIKQQWIPSVINSIDMDSLGYNRATNLDHKLDEIKRALTIFSQNPLAGVGFGRYGYYSQQLTLAGWPVYISGYPYHSHNIVSQVLAEFGVIGGIVLLASTYLLIRFFIQSYRNRENLLIFGLIVIFGINAIFEYALWNLNFAVLFFAIIAGFSNDKSIEITILKTSILKSTYSAFFGMLVLVLASRWSIIDTLSTISSKPDNIIYAQSMTEDSLMGLDFSNMYISSIKLDDVDNNEYQIEVEKIEKWRPTDLVYYRKVQLDIDNDNTQDIINNIQKGLKLGLTIDTLDELFGTGCQEKNQACLAGQSYLNSIKK